jgi:biotin carboxyl carrier protein
MKKFNITVNGKTYEVEVEELGGVSAPVSRPAAPAPAPAPKAAPAPAPKAAPAPAPKAAPAPAGGETVEAPMPGKVLRIVKGEGSAVKEGELVLILEAMKMENEIYAPCDGTVKNVTKEGTAVNPGDVLFVVG